MCETASLLALPPHVPAEKASKVKDDLNTVANIVKEGRTSCGLQSIPYRCLEQAAADHPIINDIKDKMNCPNYTAMWAHLVKAHPGLRVTKLNIKGTREPVQAQNAAMQLIGRVPMKFEPKKYNAHPLTRRVLKSGYNYFYTWNQLQTCVKLDAGKIDPQEWVKAAVGITQLGAPRHAISYQLLMKTV